MYMCVPELREENNGAVQVISSRRETSFATQRDRYRSASRSSLIYVKLFCSREEEEDRVCRDLLRFAGGEMTHSYNPIERWDRYKLAVREMTVIYRYVRRKKKKLPVTKLLINAILSPAIDLPKYSGNPIFSYQFSNPDKFILNSAPYLVHIFNYYS